MDNRKTTAKKNLSINDQLQAMQSGELVCSPEKLSACIAYCQRRLDMLHRSLEGPTIPTYYLEQAQANIAKFTSFLTWAEKQSENTCTVAHYPYLRWIQLRHVGNFLHFVG